MLNRLDELKQWRDIFIRQGDNARERRQCCFDFGVGAAEDMVDLLDWAIQQIEAKPLCKYCNDELEPGETDYCDMCQPIIDEQKRQAKPVDADVQRAIDWIEDTGSANLYMSGEWTAPMRKHITRTIQSTILAALRAQKQEPPQGDYDAAILDIHANWPPENYTALRKALTLALSCLEYCKSIKGVTP